MTIGQEIISDEYSGLTSKGMIIFHNLQINTSGNHKIKASSSDMIDTFINISVSSLQMNFINASDYPSSWPVYKPFSITVGLYDQTMNEWPINTTVTLNANLKISGQSSAIVNGIYMFSIFSTESGNLIVTIKAEDTFIDIALFIEKNYLKIESVNPIVKFI